MRMYTLWRVDPRTEDVAQLQHEGMPVLFEKKAEAEEYGRKDPEVWEETVLVLPVNVGLA